MAVTLEGDARIRKVGNGLCLPLSTRALREEGLAEGDEVHYIVYRAKAGRDRSFGLLRGLLKDVDLERLTAEDWDEAT